MNELINMLNIGDAVCIACNGEKCTIQISFTIIRIEQHETEVIIYGEHGEVITVPNYVIVSDDDIMIGDSVIISLI